MPIKNRAAIVGATLDSVARQSLRPLKVIVVDNGSTDDSPRAVQHWIAAHPDIDARLLFEPTPGACAARNRGMKEVTTPWVMFFDSDDLMAPDHVGRIVETIEANPKADLIGWDVQYHSETGRNLGRRRFYRRNMVFHTIFHGSMATQRWAARTDLVRRAGEWNNAVKRWNDIELGLRMLALKPRVVVLSGSTTVDVLLHKQSITSDHFYYDDHRIETSMDAMWSTLSQWEEDKPRYLRCLNVLRAIIAGIYTREGRVSEGRELLNETLKMPFSSPHWLMKIVYHYTSHGGRGVARILHPFL